MSAALLAVIQAELDSDRDATASLQRIALAAGLWPKGEQAPVADEEFVPHAQPTPTTSASNWPTP